PPFHPYRPFGRRSAFCGTFPRVTPGGRYPPPCPVESGLSSAGRSRALTRPPGRLVRHLTVYREGRLGKIRIRAPSQRLRTSPFSLVTRPYAGSHGRIAAAGRLRARHEGSVRARGDR